MKINQSVECQACGASSVSINKEKSMLECDYCGAMMTYTQDGSIELSGHRQQTPAKLAVLLTVIPVLVVILMIVFWIVFQNIRKHKTMEEYVPELTAGTTTSTQTVPHTSKLSLVPESRTSTNSEKETTKAQQETQIAVTTNGSLNDSVTIQSQVSGETSNGGKFWIIALKNHSNQALGRTGVMLSLFDQSGKRIEEQPGWSLREVLAVGEKTVFLLFLSEAPQAGIKQQINVVARKPSQFGLKQVDIKVQDYTVTQKNQSFDIIGDVLNQHEQAVTYTRIIAVAYDADGTAIGIGNAFSTDKDLDPNQGSGFKVRVGTFLTGEPVSWQISALARY